MPNNIKLDNTEASIWREAGSRGEKFRQAIRDRAAEQVRVNQRHCNILDEQGQMLERHEPGDRDPEAAPGDAAH